MKPVKPSGEERLLFEIAEQPRVVARILERQREKARRVAEAMRTRAPEAVVLVARGSSDNAAVYGRYLFEIRNRVLTSLAAPSTITLYHAGPRLSQSIVIGVSQSGRGEDVVTYLREARAQGALTVALVNDAASPLAFEAEIVLECLAGEETSVPATKTVTAQMALLALISTELDGADAEGGSLEALPAALDRAVAMGSEAAVMATSLAKATSTSVVGRGLAFPAALEIALKLKETSYTRAEPFSAADFLHGPVALVDAGYGCLVVDVGGHSTHPALETSQLITERGGRAFLLRAGSYAASPIDYPSLELSAPVSEPYSPILAVVLGQLLAVQLAKARGLDPAHPRGLRKITSTR